jgi:hypothetical protein
MKQLNSPRYTQKREYTPTHAVPGGGMCPQCGRFAGVGSSAASGEFRTQYRYCQCGNSFQTIIRRPAECH